MACLGSTERTLAPLWNFLPGAVRGLQGHHFQTWQPFCRAVPMGRGNHALSPVWEASGQGGACSGLCGPTAGKRWHAMMEQRVLDAWPTLKRTYECLVITAPFSGP